MKYKKPISLVVASAVFFASVPATAASAGIRHYYCSRESERAGAVGLGWVDEGTEGNVYEYISGETRPPFATIALLRLYSPITGARYLVTNFGEADVRVAEGYINEGRLGFIWPSDYNLQVGGSPITDFGHSYFKSPNVYFKPPKVYPTLPFESLNARFMWYSMEPPDDFIFTIKSKTDPINAPIIDDYAWKGWLGWSRRRSCATLARCIGSPRRHASTRSANRRPPMTAEVASGPA